MVSKRTLSGRNRPRYSASTLRPQCRMMSTTDHSRKRPRLYSRDRAGHKLKGFSPVLKAVACSERICHSKVPLQGARIQTRQSAPLAGANRNQQITFYSSTGIRIIVAAFSLGGSGLRPSSGRNKIASCDPVSVPASYAMVSLQRWN